MKCTEPQSLEEEAGLLLMEHSQACPALGEPAAWGERRRSKQIPTN